MNKTVGVLALTLACGFSMNTYAQDKIEFSGNCSYPAKPQIVNGSKASEAEMITSQKEMKDYLALGNTFLECLDKEMGLVKPDAPKEQADEFKARIDATHNAAVDDMNQIAELFNAALRAYKGKNK